MKNLQAVIADVDGVMVGKEPGVNFPLPHKDIIEALKHVSQTGVPVVLCTAKFGRAVKEIALRADLNNPHITDGGALIVRFTNTETQIVSSHIIDHKIIAQFTEACLRKRIYFELCSTDAYYIDASQVSELTDRRTSLLQQKPEIMHLTEVLPKEPIIKTVVFIKNNSQKETFSRLMDTLNPNVSYIWSHHPYLDPFIPAIVTQSGVSKESATQEIAAQLSLDLNFCLGIGDSASDWNFMSLCGRVGVVGGKSPDLIESAKTKGQDGFYLAPDVNEHGLLEIFQYFNLM